MKARIMTAAAAAIIVAGTMFAAAQGTKDPQAPKQSPETGMPSDKGEKTGKPGTAGSGAPPMAKEKNPQAPKQTPETGMPSDTSK
jgi:hypothetical protein